MKTVYSILLVQLFLTFQLYAQTYSWELKKDGFTIGGPIDHEIYNTNNIYWGSVNRVYRSSDRGNTFLLYGTPLPGSNNLKAIITHRSIPGTMLVAYGTSSAYRIVKTTNFGISWDIKQDDLDFSFFGIPIAIDPSHPDTVYTMSGKDFMRSTDFGETWNVLSSNFGPTSAPCDIEIFPDTSVILIGDNGTGIFRSTDYGLTWNKVFSTSGEIPVIAVDLQGSGTAYASNWGGGGGVLKSTDFGANWATIGLTSVNTWGVHVSPESPDYVIAACYACGNTYISRNGGSSWQTIPITPVNYQIHIVDTVTVFAGQSNGIYKLFSDIFIPVELVYFNAGVLGSEILLEWETATELNNVGFDIEQSSDNKVFEKIGFVPGFGTSSKNHNYEFSVIYETAQKYYFRLKQVNLDGSYEYSDIIEVNISLTEEFELSQNYPNPFNPTTKIKFTIPLVKMGHALSVQLKVYDVLGNEISTLVNGKKPAGIYEVEWNSNGLPSGLYYYQLRAGGFIETKKMVLLK